MDENRRIGEAAGSTPSTGGRGRATPTSARGADQTDPYEQAGSEIVELIRGFVEEVGTRRRDARSAAESARADRVEALRMRQETVRLRAEAESEAARIVDAGRAEADRIRDAARADADEIKRVFQAALTELERARNRLDEAIAQLGQGLGRPTVGGRVVIPEAPDNARVVIPEAPDDARVDS